MYELQKKWKCSLFIWIQTWKRKKWDIGKMNSGNLLWKSVIPGHEWLKTDCRTAYRRSVMLCQLRHRKWLRWCKIIKTNQFQWQMRLAAPSMLYYCSILDSYQSKMRRQKTLAYMQLHYEVPQAYSCK